MYTTTIHTPVGLAVISGNEDGITSVRCTHEPVIDSPFVPAVLHKCARQLEEYFLNRRRSFDIPLHPQGTPFQRSVWQMLAEVPYGKTMSYMELTRRLGDEKAIRAVAAANGKNPIWIIIPCHRIIGSNGDLTGYAGGLGRKKWLLEHEQVANGQLTLF
ncbi:methylated-DNA--[protein]-cysteine S-methyltransferase [Larkinella knui]|uniref:Methylated-DNA--protein-cysteine methyltransferase n=1 Tax=Larkinella knui TaxID=2025310 RepID=A0A3P1CJL3_9BACT|nr:methylated-DNA--[protein]-cysteine S-methyltransferase [Larkinella knui]RRB13531.1 methylated-DNA--[protein]-cysteine S-methyltransferase [Larkinella knui]